MRPIANALLLLAVINLSGCASLSLWNREPVKPVEVITKPIEKTPLAIPDPAPLDVPDVKWVIVTKENAQQVLSDLESKGKDPVVFGLTDDGYKDLSIMFSEIRNFISTQRQIIQKYREYYEPVTPPSEEVKK